MHRRPVDIGNGELEAVVAGDGPVTVVFENGLATPLEEWDAVVGSIAERAGPSRMTIAARPHRDGCCPIRVGRPVGS